MKGIIFTLLEKYLQSHYGEQFSEAMFTCPGLVTKEPFVSPGTYPDKDLDTIVESIHVATGIHTDMILQGFGAWLFAELSAKYPVFLNGHKNPKSYLMSVHDIIHVEVKKLYRDAKPPEFVYKEPAPDRLVIEYHSMRNLQALMAGLIEGVALHFRTRISQTRTEKMVDGRTVHVFECTFGDASA